MNQNGTYLLILSFHIHLFDIFLEMACLSYFVLKHLLRVKANFDGLQV